VLVDPQGTISLNGKTLTITLVSQITPLGTGEGVATVDYVCKCAPENDIIDTTSVSIPYTTASSPTNGYQYTITS
jgi:hypothetical protein